ncbi:MAG: thioredoxin family protein [Firmicutes bacterium]|nr:thioredoxin family protein [Bacillota bacterium]
MKILKFGAIWCPGCLSMSKIWNDIVSNNDIEIEDYDIDFDEDICENYEIGDILPVYIFMDKDNNELERLIGEQKKEFLLSKIDQYRNE